MIEIIEISLLSLLGFFLLYLLLLAVLALFAPIRNSFPATKKRKFAVVVPAHNEGRHIEKTVRSVREINYPRECYDIVVVADNCSDDTASAAWHCGATVLERNDPTKRGKGYALHWCFEKLLASSTRYEGVVVIDADSIVSKNFLEVMNWYLEQGHGSIQSADLVAPNPDAWSSEVSRISLTLYNYVRPLGRKLIHCSAGLRGNGMCFSATTLRTAPWQAHSLTEDLEYGLILLQQNIVTVFAPEAQVFATMPAKAKNAESQRARWEGGRIPIVRKYSVPLLQSAAKEFSWKKTDALIDLLTPAFVNMIACVVFVTGAKLIAGEIFLLETAANVAFWYALFGVSVMYVFLGLIAARADFSLYKSVVYFPLYLFWKIRLYGKLVVNGITREWVRTARE